MNVPYVIRVDIHMTAHCLLNSVYPTEHEAILMHNV